MEGILQAGMKPPGAQGALNLSIEDEPPKKGLSRAWEVAKMLYQNEVTRQVVYLASGPFIIICIYCRSIGRDLIFFAGAVVVIRFLVVALEEPLPNGATPPLLPLPGPGK